MFKKILTHKISFLKPLSRSTVYKTKIKAYDQSNFIQFICFRWKILEFFLRIPYKFKSLCLTKIISSLLLSILYHLKVKA